MFKITRKKVKITVIVLCVSFAVFAVFSAVSFRNGIFNRQESEKFSEDYYKYASFLASMQNETVWDIEFPEGFLWQADSDTPELEFQLTAETAGLYNIIVEYIPQNEIFEQNLFNIYLNGQAPDIKTSNVSLSSFYRFLEIPFTVNARGNDIYPEQGMLTERQRMRLKNGDQTYTTDSLLIPLNRGVNDLIFRMNEGSVIIYGIKAAAPSPPPPSYTEYRANHNGEGIEKLLVLEAEHFYYKNRSNITIMNNPSYTAAPYSTLNVELNSLSPANFQNHLDSVSYLLNIETPGYYTIGIKTTMPGKTDSPVFINIEVDGEIPFAEFKNLRLDYKRFMFNHEINDYPVYFSQGVHEITIVINGEIYAKMSNTLLAVADEISGLSLALRRLTGNNRDRNREWIIGDYLPGMLDDMIRWKSELIGVEEELLVLSGGRGTEETGKIRVSLRQLQRLIDEPDKTPYRLTILSEGEMSILQALSRSVLTIRTQPLGLDQIMLGGKQPAVKTNPFFAFSETLIQLAASYSEKPVSRSDPSQIEVWVLRSRQYVDVLQTLADERFTPAAGIKVNFSIITDQGKLTLANAAGKQPDIAIGIDQFYINDLALRGSIANLREFSNVNEMIQNAAPGSLLQMIIDDKLYGLPESQNLSLLFYRADIFEAFGWSVPDTWEEVLLMLPVLSRNGMNFYIPLASSDAFKAWPATIPFYSQRGAFIYDPQGRGTVINSEEGVAAMRFMTDLFRIYGMPLNVASFYNDFRTGRIPIGIADITEYVRLSFAAPELAGRWEVAVTPGIANSSGEVERWIASPNKAGCIFEASKKKDAAWEFLRWWLSEETQILYTQNMQNRYGQEFLWVSGNINALKHLPVSLSDREQINEQIKWLKDAPRIPGGYYTEREISNAFNRIIYDGMDVRSSVYAASIVTNREIRRKMQEFGYMDSSGGIIREYKVPEIADVARWLGN